MSRYLPWLVLGILTFLVAPVLLQELSPNRSTKWLVGGLMLLGGWLLVWSVAGLGQRTLRRMGHPHLVPAVRLIEFAGYLVVVFASLSAAGYQLSGLLAGSAVVGALVALAAQATLSNILSGLVLTVSRSFRLGDTLTVRSWAYGGTEYSGRVADLNLIHTVLEGASGQIKLPNARMVDSVIVVHKGRQTLEATLPLGITPEALQSQLGVLFEARKLDSNGIQGLLILPEGMAPQTVWLWLQNQAQVEK